MFNSKINLSNFVSDYKNKLCMAHDQNKLEREKKYAQLLHILASAANDFDFAGQEKLAQKTSQILNIVTSAIKSEPEIQNYKIASYLKSFSNPEDIIDLD